MPAEEQVAVDEARQELGNCVLNSSWVYCTGAPRSIHAACAACRPRCVCADAARRAAVAVIVSVPIGVRLKRLTPLVRPCCNSLAPKPPAPHPCLSRCAAAPAR
jgi:hypothetical protein